MACEKCDGDYVVGEGGSLVCSKCGHIAGDISLLFAEKPLEDINQHQQLGSKAPEGFISSPQKDIRELV